MQALKDVLGRAEERSNLRSLLWCTVLVIGLVTIVFGFTELRFLIDVDRGGSTDAIEESATLSADQGGG